MTEFHAVSGVGDQALSAPATYTKLSIDVTNVGGANQTSADDALRYFKLGWYALYEDVPAHGDVPALRRYSPLVWIEFTAEGHYDVYAQQPTGFDGFHHHLYAGVDATFYFESP